MAVTHNNPSRVIDAAALFAGESAGVLRDVQLTIRAGLIERIVPLPANTLPAPQRLVLPALVNAHDHARPAASSFGAMNMPLETWILRSVLGTPPDAYLQAAVSLANAAKAGCGAMMVHYTRPSGRLGIVDEAAAIARAAADIGIRLAFALAVRDQNPLVYGNARPVLDALPHDSRLAVEELFVRAPPAPESYIGLVEEIASRIEGPMVDVQFGPAGVQWCSRPLLTAIARRSEQTGRRVHMHLLETVHQRAWADREYPEGIVQHLADIGFLSERLTLAHCIHATPEELDLIARSGARIVTNFSSNLHLHSGLAPIASAHRRGCAIAVGIDGLALDEDSDMLREMRLVQMMHDGVGFERTWSRASFLEHAVATGRAATGAPGNGMLRVGAPADLAIIDLGRLDRDQIMQVDPIDLLFARGNSSHLAEVIVAGRSISADGTVAGIDLPAVEIELRRLYRAEMPRYGAVLGDWPAIEAGVGGWFRQYCGCS